MLEQLLRFLSSFQDIVLFYYPITEDGGFYVTVYSIFVFCIPFCLGFLLGKFFRKVSIVSNTELYPQI